MLLSGVSPWLTLGVLAIWLGSLWLIRPEPAAAEREARRNRAGRDILSEAIEPLDLPLVLFDRERIAAANAAARAALGAHIVGQDARIALRHPQAIRLLDLEDGASVIIPGLTGARSLWQLTRQRIDQRFWIIELADRTTEADISRAHTDFVANASHELRTPLSSLIGFIETLRGPAREDIEAHDRFLAIMADQAGRMSRLINDLLSLSRIELDEHMPPSTPVEPGAIVRGVLDALELKARERGMSLRLEGVDEAPKIFGDADQIAQVAQNLVSNAIKYGKENTEITVSLATADGLAVGRGRGGAMLALSVADRGDGIPRTHLPRLTERFYRVDAARSRALGGTGLGLAIVKHIMNRHRGRLTIESVPGEGSTFTVYFPLAGDDPS